MLHKARLLSDAKHAYIKAAQDADDDGLSAEEKRRKMIAAVPAYLKGRVERGEEELPKMEVGQSREEDVFAAVVKHMIGEQGEMAKEIFLDLMEYMVERWDDERKRA